eukprot:GILI01004575.1.p1 GENE.GILI01004575.1~~GILI01004575.1.p1  ORF type:complete len:148 (-),score=26.98 GILI01004575.1:175-618(-)
MNYLYEIKESPGKGLGIFTREFIPQGAIIWEYEKDRELEIQDEDLNSFVEEMSEADRYEVLSHGFCWGTRFNSLSNSDMRFMNHSRTPNSLFNETTNGCSIAIRDIQAGEELTENYGLYQAPPNYSSWMRKVLGGTFAELAEKFNWN